MLDLEDTIAAIATAPGPAGLAVVRLSGETALAVGDAVFRGTARLAEVPSHTLHHGWAVWPAAADVAAGARVELTRAAPPPRRLDEVVAAVFRAPRSYTCEDVVELSCHGGRLPAERVLAALLRAGARLAHPGEFTLRAFLHGRLDLAQAEAVADLIHAETEGARELALSQLAGALSRRLDELGERLSDALAEVEARVDFAEDVGGVEVPAAAVEAIAAADAELARLLESAAWARAVREGVRVPVIGRPNVGKSSLFNALLGEERAIVMPLPGTTRDRVSEAVELAGIRVVLSDTAGLRDGGDAVEAVGVERARALVAESPLALWVVDAGEPLAPEDRAIAGSLAAKRVLVALNKRDLPPRVEPGEIEALLGSTPHRTVRVSATRGDGLEALRLALAGLLGARSGGDARGPRGDDGLGAAVGNPRHAEALARARESLGRAAAETRAGSPGEIVALELREALAALGEVTGRTAGEDLLDRIFSRFCIGK